MSSHKQPKGPRGPQTGNRNETSEAAKLPGGAEPQPADSEELSRLTAEIERAWYQNRDHRAADRLAEQHPDLAHDLYEFFGTLTAAISGYGKFAPQLAESSGRTKEWLQREGFALAAAASIETTTSTPTAEKNREVADKDSSNRRPSEASPRPGSSGNKSLFATLKDLTGEHRPQALAARLDMPADFLTLISERSHVLRKGAREEVKRRVRDAWDIDPALIAPSLEGGAIQQRAASRPGPYAAPEPTYEDLVNNSSLSGPQKKFWLSLD